MLLSCEQGLKKKQCYTQLFTEFRAFNGKQQRIIINGAFSSKKPEYTPGKSLSEFGSEK
jgi:hypothetical protein